MIHTEKDAIVIEELKEMFDLYSMNKTAGGRKVQEAIKTILGQMMFGHEYIAWSTSAEDEKQLSMNDLLI